jgi:hypothetical protein
MVKSTLEKMVKITFIQNVYYQLKGALSDFICFQKATRAQERLITYFLNLKENNGLSYLVPRYYSSP